MDWGYQGWYCYQYQVLGEVEDLNRKTQINLLTSYLYIPLDDLSAHQNTPLGQVDPGQGDEGLPDDLVAGEPVKAEHHEVKGQLWHSCQWDPVEAEGLVKGGVQSLPQDSGLHPVLFLRQQGQLDVGVRGHWLFISRGQAMGFLDEKVNSNNQSII